MKIASFLLVIVLTVLSIGNDCQAARSANEVLVLYNANSPVSTAVARYYISKRHIRHVLTVKCQDSALSQANETIDYADYRTQIAAPLVRYLRRHRSINFIVLTKGMPIRITGALTGEASSGEPAPSLDSYLASFDYANIPSATKANLAGSGTVGIGWINRYYNASVPYSHARFGGYLVTRLDGYTAADAERLVDEAIEAELSRPNGKFLFDVEPDFGLGDKTAHPLNQPLTVVTAEEFYSDWNADMLHASDILEASFVPHVTELTKKFVGNIDNVIGYYSWGSNDDGFDPQAYQSIKFAPGSIGDTAVSTSARTFLPTSGGQTLMEDLIAHGLTCCQGYAGEPILDGISSPTIDVERYLSGSTMAESFYAGTKYLGWEGVCIGDPLCCPYAGQQIAIPTQAANFQESDGSVKTEPCSESGLDLCGITNGAFTSYGGVKFSGNDEFVARVSSGSSGGTIQIFVSSPTGTKIGSCIVPPTGGWQNYVTQSCHINVRLRGKHKLYLLYTGGSGNLLNVEWFAIKSLNKFHLSN